jgi:type IV pilus assembly protein PilX
MNSRRTYRRQPRIPACPHDQHGLVLFIALLVMVGLAIAGVALMRSTDTATTVTGNLVLKQAASSAVDRGIERAVNALWEVAPALDRTQHAPAQNFYACIRGAAGGCMAANSVVPKIPDLLTNANGCSGPGIASGLVANDDAGNRSCYVIERMCLNPGAAVGSNCNLATGAFGADPGTEHYVGLIRPGDAFYRVTVRVEGPRSTVTYAQAMLK